MRPLDNMESYAYGMWPVVLIHVAIFIFFVLSFLKPRKRWEWRSMGVFSAFVIALFTEMYGFPLTIYILLSLFGSNYPALDPFSHASGNLWAAFLGDLEYLSGFLMFAGTVVIIAGFVVMGAAWKRIHNAKGKIVTTGLYGWVRHPQYSALFLIMVGTLIQWPTIITLAMLPVLFLMYYRLARREEREAASQFGEEYISYTRRVPMFIPGLRSQDLSQ
ncbi:MAG: isoprenylcysteine carboxylmethyltransferase family protein, partial [Dehalococcoidia bacterium]|nr:isoprenylcysteine carboxylmethyltransferase family protein [Dehalococcoidia bacterium]